MAERASSSVDLPFATPPEVTLSAFRDEPSKAALKFFNDSPDRTLYHDEGYLSMSRRVNGWAELVVLSIKGQPVAMLPLHRSGRGKYTTGYSGMLFPPISTEKGLKKSVGVVLDFLRVNQRDRFMVYQSPQSQGGIDRSRQAVLRALVSTDVDINPSVHARAVFDLPRLTPDADLLDPEWLTKMSSYRPELRSQIRLGLRAGLEVDVLLGRNVGDTRAQIEALYPLFQAARAETGMRPRPVEELIGDSDAVMASGGIDCLVTVSQDAVPIAAVTAHGFKGFGLYWANFSSSAAKPVSANPLALHVAILALAGQGVRVFETGRIDYAAHRSKPKELDLFRYKGQFGGEMFSLLQWRTKVPLSAKLGRVFR